MKRPPLAPYIDLRVGDVLLDTSVLINARHAADLLPVLQLRLRGRAHIMSEVLVELDKGPTGKAVRSQPWFREETLVGVAALTRKEQLLRHWTSQPGQNEGEAATLVRLEQAKAELGNWCALLDDGTAVREAHELGLTATRTPALIVSTVRCGWLSTRQGWEAYRSLLAAKRRSLGPIPWSSWEDFDRLCHDYTFG